jgi:hypothetical protein
MLSLFSNACHNMALSQEFVDTPVNNLFFALTVSDGHYTVKKVKVLYFSFPRFIGLLIQNLWFKQFVGSDKIRTMKIRQNLYIYLKQSN